MAIGSDAVAGGYPLVPDTGEEGRVRWGGREINRTRDFIAQVKNLIPTRAIASGTVAYAYSGGWTVTHTIVFPVGKFTAPPVVTTGLRHGTLKANVRLATAPTTTSVNIAVYTDDQSAVDGTIYMTWIAVQS